MTGRVYFIGHEPSGVVKIGYSSRVDVRLRELQCGFPFPLELEAVAAGTPAAEQALHRRLAADRLVGEWFAVTQAVAWHRLVLNLVPTINVDALLAATEPWSGVPADFPAPGPTPAELARVVAYIYGRFAGSA